MKNGKRMKCVLTLGFLGEYFCGLPYSWALCPPKSLCRKENFMRMMLHATFPHEPFNAAVKDGSVGAKMKRILDERTA